ncbi:DNA topoisomerase 3 [Propionispira raffinosivorans]|uniref:DNA topoisomerase 3 n=1 Tax=Propionispira raffinosivorans TaxID=86959 RepID=UPI00037EC4ED|nr:DNA topoisomerase 3 [Propionispira raffinosivorans]
MRLYIAEKPSMGAEIAKCLTGPIARHDGYLVTKDGVVTWGFGHILRQAEPDEYDAKYKMWKTEDLPIIPQKWKLLIDKSCEKQFYIIKNLIDKADEIIHAGDPDREGQLLIDEVLDYVENNKPVKRILLNALDEKSIKKANATLRDNRDFFNLKQSALARARADWLIGMNLSRAYTLAARRAGHKVVLPIGRVKTPTLALVVRRERELKAFVPVDYFTIKAEFSHENGNFSAVWKPNDEQAGLDAEGRLLDEKVAQKLVEDFAQPETIGQVSLYQTTEKKEAQRLPFSLSSLQVLAGKRFGYEPQLVLDTAQKLYEKKMTTYPRSDCDYLPQNQLSDAKIILANLAQIDDSALAQWAKGTDLKIKSRAWNDKKISAHHAIIPTQVKVKLASLSETERNLYFLIAQVYIAQFFPLHVYDQTRVEVLYKKEIFAVSGRVIKQVGWKTLYSSMVEDDDKSEDAVSALPAMQKKDVVEYIDAKIDNRATKPPVRFTAATLLAGMKEIHKYVKDQEAKKKLKDVYGIGTEATRATIIDDLIKRGFLNSEGKKKYLFPTAAAYLLVDALPDEMTYPDSTAIWEDHLHSMADGDGELNDFLTAQIEFTKLLCLKANDIHLPIKGEHPCPRCKKGVLIQRTGKNGSFWGCSNYPSCHMSCDDENGKPKLVRQSYSVNSNNSTVGLPSMLSAQAMIAQMKNEPGKRGKSANVLEHMEKSAPVSSVHCPSCQTGNLRRMNGRNGFFWGCNQYPRCTATFDDENGKPKLNT